MEAAGSRALAVFGRILNARILRAHGDGFLSPDQRNEKLGWAAPASLRKALARLEELGALERGGKRMAATRLTAAGRDLSGVADALEAWLSESEYGPLELPDPAARATIRSLLSGWEAGIVQALAGRRRSLAELDAELGEHSYPALKRRFAKLKGALLVKGADEGRRSPGYEESAYLRRAAPIRTYL